MTSRNCSPACYTHTRTHTAQQRLLRGNATQLGVCYAEAFPATSCIDRHDKTQPCSTLTLHAVAHNQGRIWINRNRQIPSLKRNSFHSVGIQPVCSEAARDRNPGTQQGDAQPEHEHSEQEDTRAHFRFVVGSLGLLNTNQSQVRNRGKPNGHGRELHEDLNLLHFLGRDELCDCTIRIRASQEAFVR